MKKKKVEILQRSIFFSLPRVPIKWKNWKTTKFHWNFLSLPVESKTFYKFFRLQFLFGWLKGHDKRLMFFFLLVDFSG